MKRFLSAVSVTWLLASTSGAQEAADGVAPEEGSALGVTVPQSLQEALAAKTQGVPTEANDWMVAAAHPLAVEAGAEVLRDGGTAADAMVAVQAVLGLVEP